MLSAITKWHGPLAVDTETYPTKLLGISVAPCLNNGDLYDAIYIPFNHYNGSTFISYNSECLEFIRQWLPSQDLIGHNFTYDKTQLKKHLGVRTQHWVFDTRIGAHLSAAPSGPRKYALKELQMEILGWPERGDTELEENVKLKGGKLKNGDHYLADLPILGKYAALDAFSTIELYKKLLPFFNKHNYHDQMTKMMQYNELLQFNTDNGILVNREGLQRAHNRLLKVKDAAQRKVYKELSREIQELEQDWADRRASLYKREYNKLRYLNHPEEWQRFNLNSDSHKREMFYDKLGNTPTLLTESGKPSTSADSVRRFPNSFVEPYLTYEHANTILSSFSNSYLECSSDDSRLHPGFNICGTVSYRLSGFKPYILNAPFDEKRILKHLVCDPGYIGVHADLSAIEPTITAHYSEDPALLKVFGQGLGDIYLDLALALFPNDKELQEGYKTNEPITKEIKDRFARQRKIAKVIQLAVQYGGTGHTVGKNLTNDSIPTTTEEAMEYVRAYWRKFKKVRTFNYQLKELNRRNGYLRNVCGRIIRVPDPEYKDLSNRFIQSSAHDVLIQWVLHIYSMCKEEGIAIRPILLDCHDSTSNQCPMGQAPRLQEIYREALQKVNDELQLCVSIKAEIKLFKTLAGLKGDDL